MALKIPGGEEGSEKGVGGRSSRKGGSRKWIVAERTKKRRKRGWTTIVPMRPGKA